VTALAILRDSGRGRQPFAAEAERTATEELAEHNREALHFIDECWPLYDALEAIVLRTLGPREHQLVLRIGRLLASYELRHLPQPDEPAEMAVAA